MGARSIAGLVIGFVSACGATTQPAAVTRQLTIDPAVLATRPVCFVPPAPSDSPLARSRAEDSLRLCETAAKLEQVAVAPFGTPGCAVARITWAARATGEFEAECGPSGWYTRECVGNDVRHKYATLTVAEPNGPVIAETQATLRSTSSGFGEKTILALCRVAFHQYPQPLKNFQFDEVIDDAEQ